MKKRGTEAYRISVPPAERETSPPSLRVGLYSVMPKQILGFGLAWWKSGAFQAPDANCRGISRAASANTQGSALSILPVDDRSRARAFSFLSKKKLFPRRLDEAVLLWYRTENVYCQGYLFFSPLTRAAAVSAAGTLFRISPDGITFEKSNHT